MALVDAGAPSLLGYTRILDDDVVLALHNVSPIAQDAAVRAASLAPGAYLARDLAGTRLPVFVTVRDDGSVAGPPLRIGPYGSLVLRLTRP
jgi:hypothetical protein